MMVSSLRSVSRRLAARLLEGHVGWSSDRHIVVIESDDWGSARLPNRDRQRQYAKSNPAVTNCPYLQYDCLEGDDDLEALGDTLLSVRDGSGRPLALTANYCVANPDFRRIAASGFLEYHYEPFTETIERNGRSRDAQSSLRALVDAGVWRPQSHAREHVNISRWLSALRAGLKDVRSAFDAEIYGVSRDVTKEVERSLLASFDQDSADQFHSLASVVESGLEMFEASFGYRSETFIAPNFVISERLQAVLRREGVRALQGLKISKSPQVEQDVVRLRFQGNVSSAGLVDVVRNVVFEPTLLVAGDPVDAALAQVARAFNNKKPAVISSHRVNFMGGIDPRNRDGNLTLLRQFLDRLLERWPRVEFMTTPELVQAMESGSAT